MQHIFLSRNNSAIQQYSYTAIHKKKKKSTFLKFFYFAFSMPLLKFKDTSKIANGTSVECPYSIPIIIEYIILI